MFVPTEFSDFKVATFGTGTESSPFEIRSHFTFTESKLALDNNFACRQAMMHDVLAVTV